MNTDHTYIQHMQLAIATIHEYTDDLPYEDFATNKMAVDAVVRNLEIVGEAANSLSEEFKAQHAYIPWHEIISMRNRLIHEYFGVDTETVWETVNKDVDELSLALADLM